MTVGQRVRQRRTELGLSCEDLATLLQYKSKATVFKIENDINEIAISRLQDFAYALETTPEWLLGFSDEKTAPSERDERSKEFERLFNSIPAEQQELVLAMLKGLSDKK